MRATASKNAPRLIVNLGKRTAWGNAGALPLADRPGWYEVRLWNTTLRAWGCSFAAWWDGVEFLDLPAGDSIYFGDHENDCWRGLNHEQTA